MAVKKKVKRAESNTDRASDRDASRRRPDPAQMRRALAACFLAWIIPGGGHWFLGKRTRAILFLIAVYLMFFLGVVMDGRIYDMDQEKPLTVLATVASMGNGPAHFLLKQSKFTAYGRGDNRSPYYEFGNTFILVAGLLNMLIILDAFDVGVGYKP